MFSAEKRREARLRDEVKKAGGLAIKFVPTYFTGFPDRIVLMPGGRIWFAELKDTGLKAERLQKIVHGMLRKLGFEVWLINTDEKLETFLKLINA